MHLSLTLFRQKGMFYDFVLWNIVFYGTTRCNIALFVCLSVCLKMLWNIGKTYIIKLFLHIFRSKMNKTRINFKLFFFNFIYNYVYIKATVHIWIKKIGIFFYYIFKSVKWMNWGKNAIFFSVFKWERIFVHDICKLS